MPKVPDYGMTSEELSAFVADFAHRCGSRIITAGQAQYDRGTHQAFEEMTLDQMLEGTLEEIEDAVNHLIMTWINLRRQQLTWNADGVKL